MKSPAVVSTLGRWWETSRGLNILWIQLDLSLYHSAPLVLPRPRLICFCSRYIAVVSFSQCLVQRQTNTNINTTDRVPQKQVRPKLLETDPF